MVFGDNGILTRARESGKKTKIAQAIEEVNLMGTGYHTDYQVDRPGSYQDDNYTTIPFKSEGHYLVFRFDKTDNELHDEEGKSKYSFLKIPEFVLGDQNYEMKQDENGKYYYTIEIYEDSGFNDDGYQGKVYIYEDGSIKNGNEFQNHNEEQDNNEVQKTIDKLPTGFFILDNNNTNIIGINPEYIDSNTISYEGFDGIVVIPNEWEGNQITSVSTTTTSASVRKISGITNITKVYVQSGITSIGENTFYGCTGIKQVVIHEGVTFLGKKCFGACTGIEEVILPSTITTMDGIGSTNNIPFTGCTAITKVTIPQYVTSNKLSGAFYGSYQKIEEVKFSGTITSVCDDCFKDCKMLSIITLPDTVTNIGTAAFSGCTVLPSIQVPAGVTEIKDSTYNKCTSLNSKLVIPDRVTLVGSKAFGYCTQLEEIVFPESLQEIGGIGTTNLNPFVSCLNVKKITIPQYIASSTVSNVIYGSRTKIEEIFILNSVSSISSDCFSNCTAVNKIKIDKTEGSIAETYNANNVPTHWGASGAVVEWLR